MNKEILTQFKTHLSKIGFDAQNIQKRDPARASIRPVKIQCCRLHKKCEIIVSSVLSLLLKTTPL